MAKKLTNNQKRALWSRAYSARHRLYFGRFEGSGYVTATGQKISRAERKRRIKALDKTLKKYRDWR